MSRRWLTALLFVLAMTVQVFAPVANGVAAAHGLDTLAAGEICLTAAQSDHGSRGQPLHGHHHHHDCALCQAFCDGVAPVAARLAALAAPTAQWTCVQWSLTHQTMRASPRDAARQARAPPVVA